MANNNSSSNNSSQDAAAAAADWSHPTSASSSQQQQHQHQQQPPYVATDVGIGHTVSPSYSYHDQQEPLLSGSGTGGGSGGIGGGTGGGGGGGSNYRPRSKSGASDDSFANPPFFVLDPHTNVNIFLQGKEQTTAQLSEEESTWRTGNVCRLTLTPTEVTVYWNLHSKELKGFTAFMHLTNFLEFRVINVFNQVRTRKQKFWRIPVIYLLATALFLLGAALLFAFLGSGLKRISLLYLSFALVVFASVFFLVILISMVHLQTTRSPFVNKIENFSVSIAALLVFGTLVAGSILVAVSADAEESESPDKFFKNLYCTGVDDSFSFPSSPEEPIFNGDTCGSSFAPYLRAFHAMVLVSFVATVFAFILNNHLFALLEKYPERGTFVHFIFHGPLSHGYPLSAYLAPSDDIDAVSLAEEVRKEFLRFKKMGHTIWTGSEPSIVAGSKDANSDAAAKKDNSASAQASAAANTLVRSLEAAAIIADIARD